MVLDASGPGNHRIRDVTAVDWLNPCQRSRDMQYVCLIDQEAEQYRALYGQTMQL